MEKSDVRDCILLSEACYLTRYQAEDVSKPLGIDLLATIHRGTAHCYLFRRRDPVTHRVTIYFATRGTDITSLKNLIMDSRALPVWEPGIGLVHRGFLQWSGLLWDEVAAYLIADGIQADRVVFCGHSAGGAASNIMAVRASGILTAAGQAKPWLVTVGSPMVGTWGFGRYVAKATQHVRVTNNNDPIPHVPIWPLFMHAGGTRYHIRADGMIKRNPDIVELIADVPRGICRFMWQLAKNAIKRRSILLAVLDGLSSHDHFVHNYRNDFR